MTIHRFSWTMTLMLLGTTLLLGCASLVPKPEEEPKRYVLDHIKQSGGDQACLDRYLMVDTPLVYSALDTRRIVLKPQEHTIDYYADAEWADQLATLIQESLIYSLGCPNRIRFVGRLTEGTRIDYILRLDVRGFHVDHYSHGKKPHAIVEYGAQLIKMPERQVVATRLFHQSLPIKNETMDEIIQVLNHAHLGLTTQISEWVVGNMR